MEATADGDEGQGDNRSATQEPRPWGRCPAPIPPRQYSRFPFSRVRSADAEEREMGTVSPNGAPRHILPMLSHVGVPACPVCCDAVGIGSVHRAPKMVVDG